MSSSRPTPPAVRRDERGVVLIFVMIALLILMIGAVALVRSFNGSLFMAGNLAFKRDLQNQGERAVDKVLANFRAAGPLSTSAARAANSLQYHYSASALPTNATGIPLALQNSSTYQQVADETQDIKPSTDPSIAPLGVTIQYVVDRLCTSAGDESVIGTTSCSVSTAPVPAGTSSSNLLAADRNSLCATCVSAAPQGVIYRITVKLAGPRGTYSYFQSTFTLPSTT